LKNDVTSILANWFLEPLGAVGVDEPSRAARLQFENASPNPSSAATVLRFSLPMAGLTRLELIDVGGRRVRVLADGTFEAGAHEVRWDGRDAGGALAPAGLYWARLESAGASAVRRIVRVK